MKDLLDRLWRWQCGFCIQYRSGLSASCGGCLVAAPVAQGAQQLCLVYEEFNFLRIVQLAVQRLHGNFMRCWSAAIAEPATAEWGPQLCHSHSGVGSLPKNAPMKPQSVAVYCCFAVKPLRQKREVRLPSPQPFALAGRPSQRRSVHQIQFRLSQPHDISSAAPSPLLAGQCEQTT